MKLFRISLVSAVLFTLTALFCFGQVAPGVGSPGASAGATAQSGQPGSGTVTSVSIVPSSTVTGTVDTPTTTPAITLTAIGVQPPATGNALISGGGVGFVSGLTLTVGAATYEIQGVQYTSPLTNLTASAADSTNPRTDVVYVDNAGHAGILTGTPGNPAIKPQVDPTTQLELTSYDLAANATVLPVTTASIYEENTEWATATNSAGTINLASTNNPYRGTVDIEGTAVVTGNSFTFTAPSDFSPGAFTTLFFYVAPKASWPNAKQFSVQFEDVSGNAVGGIVTFKSGTFGFNSGATANVYQQVAIPVSLFGANGQTNARKLVFTLKGGGGSIGFYMDDFTLQNGLAPTPPNSYLTFRGQYSSTISYSVNDVVVNGTPITQYVAIAPSVNHAPPAPANPPSSNAYWAQSAGAGFENLTGDIVSTGKVTSFGAKTGTGSTAVVQTSPTINTPTLTGPLLSGVSTQTGTTIVTPAPMAALVIDIAQRFNTKTNSSGQTFTFSGTPAVGQWFGTFFSNSSGSPITHTIPNSRSIGLDGTITAVTTFTIPANGSAYLSWQYDGTNYNVFGVPANLTAGTVTNVTGTSPIASSGGATPAISLNDTAVTPGSYTNTNLTVDQKGRITAASNGSGGSGTVTSVSVTTANGVSGTVANATTTPAISLTLGAITPTTVNGNTFTTGSSTYTGTAGQTYTMPATSATLFGTTTKADVLEAATFVAGAGTTNTFTATLSPAITAYVTGAHYRFSVNAANTGAATVNFNGLGAVTIKKAAGGITTDLAANDIRSGQWVDVVYDGTNMQMQSTLGNSSSGGSGTVNSGTANQLAYYATSTNAVSGTTNLDYNGSAFRVLSVAPVAPVSGKGIEIFYDGTADASTIQTYDRTGAAYKPAVYNALSHTFRISGADQFAIDSTGLKFPAGFYMSQGGSGKTIAQFNSQLRITSSTAVAPASGKGIEMFYDSTADAGNFTCYDRTGSAYKPVVWDELQATFRASGTDIMVVSSTGVAITPLGKTLSIKSGTNGLAGTVTLSSGAATITSTAIDVNTVIIFSLKTSSGTPATTQPLAAVGSGSATVTGAVTDNSTYNWVALKVN